MRLAKIANRFAANLAKSKVRQSMKSFLAPFTPEAMKFLLDRDYDFSYYTPQEVIAKLSAAAKQYTYYLKVVNKQDLVNWLQEDLPSLYQAIAGHPNGEEWFNRQIDWMLHNIFGVSE